MEPMRRGRLGEGEGEEEERRMEERALDQEISW